MEIIKRNIAAITVACTIFGCSPSGEWKRGPIDAKQRITGKVTE